MIKTEYPRKRGAKAALRKEAAMKRFASIIVTLVMVASTLIFPQISLARPNAAGTVTVIVNDIINAVTDAKAIVREDGYQVVFNYTLGVDAPALCDGPDTDDTDANQENQWHGIKITIPNDFPIPSANPADEGFITSSIGGTTYVDRRNVYFYFPSATAGTIFTVTYGNATTGLTMPERPNKYTFSFSSRVQTVYDVTDACYHEFSTATTSFGIVSPSPQVPVLSNMTPATLTFDPNVELVKTEVNVNFQLGAGEERSLYTGDKISILFDWDPSVIPAIQVVPAVGTTCLDVPMSLDKNLVTVNGTKCTVSPTVIDLGGFYRVDVYLPRDIRCSNTTGAAINIKFDRKLAIIQGSGPPYFRAAKIATIRANNDLVEPDPDYTDGDATDGYLLSNAYAIGTTLNAPAVTVISSIVDENAEYYIGASPNPGAIPPYLIPPCGTEGSFQIGPNGTLLANDGVITFEFPTGTTVPQDMSPGAITVTNLSSGVGPNVVSSIPQISGNKVAIKTPIDINPLDCILVHFSKTAHIENPPVGADDYYIKIWTSSEPTVITSMIYSIVNPGWGVVNVDPNLSFTDLGSTAGANECYVNSNQDVYPPGDESGAKYTFQFSLSDVCSVTVGDSFIITLDGSYTAIMPHTTATPTPIPPQYILVNGVQCSVGANIAPVPWGPTSIEVISPVSIMPGSQVTITFLPSAGLENPDIEEEKVTYVATINVMSSTGTRCQEPITTQSYFITTKINHVELVPDFTDGGLTWAIPPYTETFKPAVNVTTMWRFDFCVGDYGNPLLGIPNLVPGDTITVMFPEGVNLPSTLIGDKIKLIIHDIATAGQPLNAAGPTLGVDVFECIGIIDENKVHITVPSGCIVEENTKLTVFFPESLGIRTPSSPGTYIAMLKTSKETTYVPSDPFQIGTVVSDIGVTVTPNTSSSKDQSCLLGTSEYIVRFRLGTAGNLSPGNTISVEFPAGFALPMSLNINTVVLNGVSNPTPIILYGNYYEIPVQTFLAAGSIVEVIFTKTAGISNPAIISTPATYRFKLRTTREPAWVDSAPFDIISKVCMNCADAPNYYSVHYYNDGTALFDQTAIMMGTVEGWLVGFETGDVGAFTQDVTTVTIEFPEGMGVPSYISQQYVRCYTSATFPIPPAAHNAVANCSTGMQATRVQVDGNKVTITWPTLAVGPNIAAYIYFCEEANLSAPMIPGDYVIKVYTDAEPESVNSCVFSVLARGMSPAIVTPIPSIAGAPNVEYKIEFTLGQFGGLSVGDTIKIDFMRSGALRQTIVAAPGFSGNQIPPMYVRVNNVECMLPITYVDPVLGVSGLVFYVQTPVSIPAGGRVEVFFTKSCRITNPSSYSPPDFLNSAIEPNYMVTISTNREITPIESEEYEITHPDATTRPDITNTPCVADIPAVYEISFYTPEALVYQPNDTPPTYPGTSTIELRFPDGFYLPNTMLPSAVQINEYLCVVPPQIVGHTVILRVPTNIDQWSKVTVKFDPSLMLYNPAEPGTYKIASSINGSLNAITGDFVVCKQINICRVDISPSGQISVPLGGTHTFQANVFDCQGQIIQDNVDINWSFGSSAGYISPLNGRTTTFTAFQRGQGVLMVSATYGNKTMTATTTIIVTGSPASLIITPGGPSTLVKNNCYTFSAQMYDDNNPPQPITASGVTYEWSLTNTSIANIAPITGRYVELCPTDAGGGAIVCKAKFEGQEITARSDFIVKSGIYTLAPIPSSELGQIRVGQLSPDLQFELRDDNGVPVPAKENINVIVESTSPTGRFSKDKVTWTTTNKIELSIIQGFTKTETFFYSDSTTGNVSLSGYAADINPAYIRLTMTGPAARLSFTNPYRVTSASSPSEALTLSVVDEFGNISPPSSDTVIILSSYKVVDGQVSTVPSSTGEFSASPVNWSPLPGNMLTLRAGQQNIDVFYKDTVKGYYMIKATTAFFGQAGQTIEVTDETGVSGNLTVQVERPIAGVETDYIIDFRVGSGGAMGSNIGHIYFRFPPGTTLPGLSKADVEVNGTPCQATPIVDNIAKTIEIITPVSIGPNSDVKVKIPRIINPPEGTYTLDIWTSAEPKVVTSRSYQIGVSTVSQLRVSVMPNSVGLAAKYTVEFKTGPSGTLGVNDTITIQFPVGTVLATSIDPTKVQINGVLCTKKPLVQGLQMTLYNPMPIQAEQDVGIVIDELAGVKNPPIPRTDYVLKLATTSDSKFTDSSPYEIKQASTISNVKVTVVPPTVDKKAKYSINLTLGQNGALFAGDKISIQMNDQVLPTAIPKIYVSVNGIEPASDIIVDGKRLIITLAQGIAAGQNVVVNIEEQGGVRNPSVAGNDYRIAVFTSKEPYAVSSDPFTIESSIVVSYSVSPSVPDGQHGWYTVTPTITLECNVSASIMYRYEGESNYTTYTGPFQVSKTGQIVIYYKAKSLTSGTESVEKDIVIKYDPSKPELKFPTLPQTGEKIQTKDGSYTICGNIGDVNDVDLTMNGTPVPVGADGSFCVTVALVSGDNDFEFCATDYAGNKVCQKVTIEKKDKPPVLTITEPGFMTRITTIEFPYDQANNTHQLKIKMTVKGATEPGISEIIITPKTVEGESQKISVNPDGTFEGTVVFNAIGGLNTFEAVATDKLGNVATVNIKPVLSIDFRLTKDNINANLNGLNVELLAAPYISTTWRTMVPFRIMGEAIGAKIGWDGATRTASFELGDTIIKLKINSSTATVIKNGVSKTVTLDAPAVIKSGSTMVPFRFVAENFGATVSWDNNTKTARMVYP